MSKKSSAPPLPGRRPTPAAPKATAHVGDPYWGVGGRYVVGVDGVRRPAEPVPEPTPAPLSEPNPDPTPDPTQEA